jgi:hypothetical protein
MIPVEISADFTSANTPAITKFPALGFSSDAGMDGRIIAERITARSMREAAIFTEERANRESKTEQEHEYSLYRLAMLRPSKGFFSRVT